MATKKKKRNAYDVFANQYGERYNSARPEAQGIYDSLSNEGVDLSGISVDDIAIQLAETGEFNYNEPSAAPAPTPLDPTAGPQMSAYEPGFFERLTARSPAELAGDAGAALRSGARTGLADLLEAPVQFINAAGRAWGQTAGLGSVPLLEQPEFVTDEATRLREEAGTITAADRSTEGRIARDRLDAADGFLDTLGTLAANPTVGIDYAAEQAGNILPSTLGGGPTGMLAVQAAQAGSNSANETRQRVLAAGGTEQEAERAADQSFLTSATINFAIPSVIPGGQSLESLVTRGAAGRVSSALTPLLGETAEEGITEGLDQIQQNVFSGDPWDQNVGKAVALGMTAGAGMGAAPAVSASVEKRRNDAIEIDETANALLANRNANLAPQGISDPKNDLGLTPKVEESGTRANVPSPDEVFAQAEQEAAAQKEVEQEAGFRTIERDANLPRDRVERYADVVERVPVNPPAEVTPEQIIDEREQQAAEQAAQEQAAAAQQAESERVKQINETARLREQARKTEEKRREDAAKKAAAADKKRREELTKRYIAENPELDDAAITDRVNEELSQPVEPAAVAAAPITTPPAAQPAAEPTPQVTPAQPAAEDARTKFRRITGKDVPDADQTLAMEASVVPAQPKGDFADRATNLVKDLVRRDTQESRGVRELIRQGKLVVTDTPESVGRTASERGAAQYDPSTGQMFLWLDRLGDKSSVPSIIAATHEATHAGQFNDRQGRSSVLKQMMSPDAENAASQAILRAAGNGNTIAQEAVNRASAASPNARVQDLELVPYFVTLAAERRGGTLGALRGVANDVVASGRNFLRNNLGVDLDVNLTDIDSAVKEITGEIAQTDLVPTRGRSMEIIAGQTAVDFQPARREGRTYILGVDFDTGERFEIPDTNAELRENRLVDLTQQNMRLGQVLDHPDLFRNYPQLADYTVKTETLPPGVYGYHNPNTRTIVLSKDIANAAAIAPDLESFHGDGTNYEFARNIILHETQHAVQRIEGFVEGASAANFIPPDIRRERDNAVKAYDRFVESFAEKVDEAIDSLPPAAKATWEQEVQVSSWTNLSPEAKTIMFLNEGYAEDSPSRLVQAVGRQWGAVQRRRDAAVENYNNANTKAYETYLRDHGETEARNTERRSRMLPQALIDNPPVSTYDQPVERTLDTTPYAINRTFAAAETAPDVLEMAATPATAERVADMKPSERLFRVMRHQTNSRTADVNNAEDLFNQMERAVNKAVVENPGVNVKADINKMLKNVDKLEGSAQDAAWTEFSNKYPNVAPLVKAARDQIDRNTMDIIQTRLNDPRPLTPAEDKAFSKLMDDMGKYLHRSYAAYQGQTGREFASARMKGFDKAVRLLKENKSVPAKLREHYDATLGAIDFLVDRITIPDLETLQKSSMEMLERMYETWVGPMNQVPYDPSSANANAEKKALMVRALDLKRANVSADEIQREARRIADGIIGINEAGAGFGQSFTALARDTGVMERRQSVPPEIRRFLGEYKDPSVRVLTTLAAQAGFLARARALAELKSDGNGSLVVSRDDARRPGNEGFSVELSGEQYGPLNGWFATPETAAKVQTLATITFDWERAWNEFGSDPQILTNKVINTGLRGLRKASAAQKMMTVIVNPYKWVRNFAGSPLLTLREGNINPVAWFKGGRGASDYIYNTATGRVTDNMDNYIRYLGIESARVAEVQRILGSTLEDAIKGKSNAGNTAWQKIKRTGRTGIAAYSMADAWTKIANFEARTSLLRNFYEAAGITRTEEQILQEAGDDTNYTNISYDRASNVVRGLEKSGLSQYAPYFSEVFRTTYTNWAQAYADIKRATDPTLSTKAAGIMMYAGMSRFIGNTLTTFGLPFAASLAGAALSGGDDDNWRRNLISQFNKNQDLIHFGDNEDGMPVFLPIGMADPLGPVTDLMRTWMFTAGTETEKAQAVLKQMYGLYVAPSWAARTYDAITRTTQPEPRLSRMFPDAYQNFVRTLENPVVSGSTINRAVFAVESWMPDWLKSYDPRTQPDLEGNFTASALSAMGAQFETLNPQARVTQANFEQDGERSAALNNVNVLLSNRTDLTENEVKSALVSFRQSEMDRLQKVYNLRVTLEKWGQDEAAIRGILKDGGFSKADIAAVYSSNPQVRLSLKSLNQYVEGKAASSSAEERDRRKTTAAENVRKLRASRQMLADLGIVLEK